MTSGRDHPQRRIVDVRRTASYFAGRDPAAVAAYLQWRARRLVDRVAARDFEVVPDDLPTHLDDRLPGVAGRPSVASIADHFRGQDRPRFRVLDDDRAWLVDHVAPAERARTIAEAESIGQGRFTFRGLAPIHLEAPIDWRTTPEGNVDWRWDLNRHRYFETLGRAAWYTGDERHVRALGRLIVDWTQANPARTGSPAWSSVFEVALRIDGWLAAFHLARRWAAFSDDALLALLAGLLAHGRFLQATLERHVPNNHLLLEAKALCTLGLLMPELPGAEGWLTVGRRVLDRELAQQVCADGGHAERTPLYHRMITGELLELAVLHQVNGLAVPPSVARVLPGMVDFEVAMTRPDGGLSLFSDSVQADTGVRFSPATAGPAWLATSDRHVVSPGSDREGADPATPAAHSILEADAWLLGQRAARRAAPQPASRAFPVTGFATMRSGRRHGELPSLLVFDCGPFGYRPMPTHGHADALSFELWAAGRLWVTDSGGYNLHLGPTWRDYFRSTRAHNTMVIDEVDQSVLLGARRVYRPAEAALRCWRTSAEADLAVADHDGYERLQGRVRHSRSMVALRDGAWLVIDRLKGAGRHRVEALFHLPADLAVELAPSTGAARASEPEGRFGLWVVPADGAGWQAEVIAGQTDPPQGWVSVESGRREAAPVIRYFGQPTLPLMTAFLLVVGPLHPGGPSPSVTIEATEPTWQRLRISRDGRPVVVTIDDSDVRLDRPAEADAG